MLKKTKLIYVFAEVLLKMNTTCYNHIENCVKLRLSQWVAVALSYADLNIQQKIKLGPDY